jgi:hypothetical protein
MEFEKAIFRVHERSLYACAIEWRSRQPGRALNCFRLFTCVCTLTALLILIGAILLHITVVNSSGCLHDALVGAAGAWIATGALVSIPGTSAPAITPTLTSQELSDLLPSIFPMDSVFRISIDFSTSSNSESDVTATRKGVVLQASLLPICSQLAPPTPSGNGGSSVQCFSVFPQTSALNNASAVGSTIPFGASLPSSWVWQWGNNTFTAVPTPNITNPAAMGVIPTSGLPYGGGNDDYTGDPLLPTRFGPDFVFSFTQEAMTMGQITRSTHGYKVVNLSLPAQCAAAYKAVGSVAFWTLFGYETAMVNAAMRTFPGRTGYLLATYSGETWAWPDFNGEVTSLLFPTATGQFGSLLLRIYALFLACISYAVISTVTAVLVRLVLASGPVILYPFTTLILSCPCFRAAPHVAQTTQAHVQRTINWSYPWLGVHVRYMRVYEARETEDINPHLPPAQRPLGQQQGYIVRQSRNACLFYTSHIAFIIISFIAYGFTYASMSGWVVLWKSHPQGLDLGIWVWFLVTDYVGMVWLRTRASLKLVPRLHFLLYIAFYCYYISTPYPASDLVLAGLVLGTFALLLATIYAYEIPGLALGKVTWEQPRQLCVRTAAPELPDAMPAFWTVLHPLNAIWPASNIYGDAVPPVPSHPLPPSNTATRETGGGGDTHASVQSHNMDHMHEALDIHHGSSSNGELSAVIVASTDGENNGSQPLLDANEYVASRLADNHR